MNNAYKQLTTGLLIAAVVALFLAAATFLVSGIFGSATKILLIVGIGLLLGYFVAAPESVLGAFRSRGVRYGGNTFAMVALFIGIIGAGNWFVNQHSQTFDLTANKVHTLSQQTKDIVHGLQQPVTVTAFFTADNFQMQQAKDLLQLYASQGSQFTYTFVDPIKDPVTTSQFGIVSDGTTVFKSANNRKDVASVDEQDYTSALLAVTNAERRKVYFVTGNGQADPTQAQQTGFHDALLALQNDNYVVDTLDATATTVPDDAAAVILTAGTKPLLDTQQSTYLDYLRKGGKMLIGSAAFADNAGFNAILQPFGLQFQDGVTIEANPSLYTQQFGPTAPVITRFQDPNNEIVKQLSLAIFRNADGLKVDQTTQGITHSSLAQTSDQSWLQNHKDQAQFRDGDTRGPIVLMATAEGTLPAASSAAASAAAASAAAASAAPTAIPTLPPASPTAAPSSSSSSAAKPAPSATPSAPPQVTGSDINLKGGARIVAVADTEWMNDQFLDLPQTGNHDLLLHAVAHLVGNSALISIAPKNTSPGQLSLLGSDANLIFFSTVIFVPLAVIVVGAVVWYQRR